MKSLQLHNYVYVSGYRYLHIHIYCVHLVQKDSMYVYTYTYVHIDEYTPIYTYILYIQPVQPYFSQPEYINVLVHINDLLHARWQSTNCYIHPYWVHLCGLYTTHGVLCWPCCYTCTVIHLIDWRWCKPGDHERNGRTNWLEEHVGTNVVDTTKTKTRH